MMIITPTKASKNLQPGFIWSIWALSPEDSCFWDHQRKLFVLLFISDFDAWFHIFIIESYRLVTRLFLFNIREVNWLPISAYFYLFNFFEINTLTINFALKVLHIFSEHYFSSTSSSAVLIWRRCYFNYIIVLWFWLLGCNRSMSRGWFQLEIVFVISILKHYWGENELQILLLVIILFAWILHFRRFRYNSYMFKIAYNFIMLLIDCVIVYRTSLFFLLGDNLWLISHALWIIDESSTHLNFIFVRIPPILISVPSLLIKFDDMIDRELIIYFCFELRAFIAKLRLLWWWFLAHIILVFHLS
jgi:hypothetical protein